MEQSIPERLDEDTPRDTYLEIVDLNKKAPWSHHYNQAIRFLLSTIDDKDKESLVKDILERFHYMNGLEYERALESIAEQISVNWGLTPETTVVISKNLDDGSDSSNAVLQNIKHRFSIYKNWKDRNFSTNVRACLKKKKIVNFVVVDDFTGTGNQLANFCDWFTIAAEKSERSDAKLYVAFVAAMQPAQVRAYPPILKAFHAHAKLTRGISDHFTAADLQIATQLMSEIEDKFGIPDKYQFGYERCEAIHYCETLGVPNNVFPIFWSRKLPRQMFRRL